MDFDVIAIGGGFAGMVTASRAAQLGLKAAVFERQSEDRYPCNSRYSSGVFAIMAQPVKSDPEFLFDVVMKGTGGTAKPELARMVASNARRAREWLLTEGARFIEIPFWGSNTTLAPPRRIRHGLDWEGRGSDALLRRLESNLMSRGGRLFRGHEVRVLDMQNGTCVGVEVADSTGSTRYRAKAVVIADGGYQADPEMVRQHISESPERVLLRAANGGRGDGIRMAEKAGAAIGGFGSFYGHLQHRDAMTNKELWPYPQFDAVAEAGLLVGPDGQRFTDEGLGGVCMANAIARLPDPLSVTLIFDNNIWTGGPGSATPVPANQSLATAGGWMHSAPTIQALADKAGLPAVKLEQTIRSHNDAVASGRFSDLTPTRSTHRSVPLPIAVPPFHAIPLCAGMTLTMGGVAINEHAQALRSNGSVINGLYVVGTPVWGLDGGPRAGYVGGISKAFILGVVAAEHIARHS